MINGQMLVKKGSLIDKKNMINGQILVKKGLNDSRMALLFS